MAATGGHTLPHLLPRLLAELALLEKTAVPLALDPRPRFAPSCPYHRWPSSVWARASLSVAASFPRVLSAAARTEFPWPTYASGRLARAGAAGPAPPSPARSGRPPGRR